MENDEKVLLLQIVVVTVYTPGTVPDVLPCIILGPLPLQVVKDHLPGGAGGQVLLEVVVEGVVRQLYTLLRTVGPKVPQQGLGGHLGNGTYGYRP